MLVYGDEYRALGEIEQITKNGHGMMTFGGAESGLDEFYVGVLDKGLFQAWLSHRNIDVSGFPDSKKKVEKPGYLFPSYDMLLNFKGAFPNGTHYRRKYCGSYVDMLDMTGRAEERWNAF